jgi:hypothetical protein
MGIYMKSRPFDVDRSTAMIARMLPSARLALAGILVLLSALPAGVAPAAAEAATTFRWRWQKIFGPGDHPWTESWRTGQSGPFCDHAGETSHTV